MATYVIDTVSNGTKQDVERPSASNEVSPLSLPDALLAQTLAFFSARDMMNFSLVCKNALPEGCFFLIVKNAVLSFKASLGHLFMSDKIGLFCSAWGILASSCTVEPSLVEIPECVAPWAPHFSKSGL